MVVGAVVAEVGALGGAVAGAVRVVGGLAVGLLEPAPLGRGGGPASRLVRSRMALRPAARMIATTQRVIPIFRIAEYLDPPH